MKIKMTFLVKYWRNLSLKHKETSATVAKLRQTAEDLIAQLKSIGITQLIGIPLQIKMLADIYFEKINGSIRIINFAYLYHEFIEAKIRIQIKEKSKRVMTREKPEKLKREKEMFYSDHIKLSSLILFEQSNPNDIDLELDEQEILEYGVIVSFTNKTPSFLHQSFAEFFLAKSCLQKINGEQKRIKDDKELEQILREERHFLIRKFLNDLMEIDENQKEENKNDEKEDFNQEIENCCHENLLSLLKYFIDDQGAQLETENDFLIWASWNGHKDIVAFLLEKGIDINQQKKENNNDDEELSRGTTALTVASEQGHEVIVQILLYYKDIDINQKDKDGKTALMEASENGKKEIVKLLLERDNIEINQTNKYGSSALMHASEQGHEEIVKMLENKRDLSDDK
jgi:hypothetical protein